MNKDTYLSLTNQNQLTVNQVLQISDAYLEELGKECDVRGLYNLSQHPFLTNQHGMPIQIDGQQLLGTVFETCKKYFDEKFEIQRYNITFDQVKDNKYKKKLYQNIPSGHYQFLTS